MKRIITTIYATFIVFSLNAQPPCDSNFTEILVTILTDQYGYETS